MGKRAPAEQTRYTAATLREVLALDEARWLATNAPIQSFNYFEVDRVFLRLLDIDNDGRIRANEVKSVLEWLLDALEDTAPIEEKSREVRLANLKDERLAAKFESRLPELRPDLYRDGALTVEPRDVVVRLSDVRREILGRRESGLHEEGVVFPSAVPEDEDATGLSAAEIREFIEQVAQRVRPVGGGVSRGVSERQETGVRMADLHTYWRQQNQSDLRYKNAIERLLEKSKRNAAALEVLQSMEKLILCQANILDFVNSYVVFPHLHDPKRRALFEMGTLVMEGRHFNFCTKVLDRERHARFSAASNMFVVYAEVCWAGQRLFEVAAPVTSGGKGTLQVGTVGVFESVAKDHFHATIVEIVENPISLAEAIAAPFKRLGRAIAARLEETSRRAETVLSGDEKALSSLPQSASSGGAAIAGPGIAVGVLGGSLAFVIKTLSDLDAGQIVVGLLVIVLIVLVPTAILAFWKLWRRDVGSLLAGAGWAINRRMRLTRRQAKSFTHPPQKPRRGSSNCRSCDWVTQETRSVRGAICVLDSTTKAPVHDVDVHFSRYPPTLRTDVLGRVSHEMKLPLPEFHLKATLSHPAYETKVVRERIVATGDRTDEVDFGEVELSPRTTGGAP